MTAAHYAAFFGNAKAIVCIAPPSRLSFHPVYLVFPLDLLLFATV